ncbi:transporter [Acinetobacter pragensis]|uniref:transporter n=1 Tax=Acinetobacter pragensis TaxID=1806892 RepID=UPI003340564D
MHFRTKNAPVLMLGALLASQSHAIDVNAGDYTALPSGTNVGVFYYQHSEMEGYYQNGDKARADSRSDIGIARFIHYTDIAGLRATPQVVIPFGSVRNTQIGDAHLNNASGFADPIIASAFWLINQPEQGVSGRYLALTPFIYLPLGQYDKNDTVNLGENRFKYDLQLAWVQPLYGKLGFEFYQDAIWYGDNDEAGSGNQTLSQDTSYQTQVNLRYDLNAKQRVALGYAANYGGEQSLDGIKLQQNMEKQQARFEFQQMINPRTQLSAQLVSDTQVESGFKKELGLNFRLFYIF